MSSDSRLSWPQANSLTKNVSPLGDAVSDQSSMKNKKRDASHLSTVPTENGSSVVSLISEEVKGIPAKKNYFYKNKVRAEGTKPLRVVIDGINVAQCRERDLPSHAIDDARAVSRA